MEVSLISDYLDFKREKLMAEVSTAVLKKTLQIDRQITEEIINRMGQVRLNDNPSGTGKLLNIRV